MPRFLTATGTLAPAGLRGTGSTGGRYGDISPQNDAERIYVILALFVGTSYFSYVIGSVCGVLAKLSEKEDRFATLMRELNAFMRDAELDGKLCARLRAYFRFLNKSASSADCNGLLEKMTPALRGAVALALHAEWIEDLRPFRSAPKALLIRLSFLFRSAAFSPEEELVSCGQARRRPVAALSGHGCCGRRGSQPEGGGGAARRRWWR